MNNEDILNECLEAIARGETEESCLARYPEQASEIRPLLQVIIASQGARQISPRPEYRARARYEYRCAVAEVCAKSTQRGFRWRWRWSTAVPLVIAVIAVAGGGIVAASTNALPGQPLYGIKLATEEAQIRLTPTDKNKAKAYALIAERRLTEIIVLAERGDFNQANGTLLRLDSALNEVTAYLQVSAVLSIPQITPILEPTDLVLLDKLQTQAAFGKDKIVMLQGKMPRNAQEILGQILTSYDIILDATPVLIH